MWSSVTMVTALVVALTQHHPTAHAQNDFYDSKIQSEYTNASLYCSNITDLPINDTNPVSWMLPDLTVLYHSIGKYIISPDNWTLTIQNATADDLGLYHCLLPINGTNDYFLVKLGLNAAGPYFEDLWDKYMMNTIIGLSAGGGFALLCLFLYLVDRFRYRGPEVELDNKPEIRGEVNDGYPEAIRHDNDNRYHIDNMDNKHGKQDLGRDNKGLDYYVWEHDTAL